MWVTETQSGEPFNYIAAYQGPLPSPLCDQRSAEQQQQQQRQAQGTVRHRGIPSSVSARSGPSLAPWQTHNMVSAIPQEPSNFHLGQLVSKPQEHVCQIRTMYYTEWEIEKEEFALKKGSVHDCRFLSRPLLIAH